MRGWDAFWALYPKKESKLDAVRAWKKIKISDHDAVMNALRAQLQTGQALGGDRDPQFIPLAATWLNKGRWTDPLRQVPKTALNRNAPMQDRMAGALNLLNGPSTQKAIES